MDFIKTEVINEKHIDETNSDDFSAFQGSVLWPKRSLLYRLSFLALLPLFAIYLLGFSSPFWLRKNQVDKYRGHYNFREKVDVTIGLWRVCEGANFWDITDCTVIPDVTHYMVVCQCLLCLCLIFTVFSLIFGLYENCVTRFSIDDSSEVRTKRPEMNAVMAGLFGLTGVSMYGTSIIEAASRGEGTIHWAFPITAASVTGVVVCGVVMAVANPVYSVTQSFPEYLPDQTFSLSRQDSFTARELSPQDLVVLYMDPTTPLTGAQCIAASYGIAGHSGVHCPDTANGNKSAAVPGGRTQGITGSLSTQSLAIAKRATGVNKAGDGPTIVNGCGMTRSSSDVKDAHVFSRQATTDLESSTVDVYQKRRNSVQRSFVAQVENINDSHHLKYAIKSNETRETNTANNNFKCSKTEIPAEVGKSQQQLAEIRRVKTSIESIEQQCSLPAHSKSGAGFRIDKNAFFVASGSNFTSLQKHDPTLKPALSQTAVALNTETITDNKQELNNDTDTTGKSRTDTLGFRISTGPSQTPAELQCSTGSSGSWESRSWPAPPSEHDILGSNLLAGVSENSASGKPEQLHQHSVSNKSDTADINVSRVDKDVFNACNSNKYSEGKRVQTTSFTSNIVTKTHKPKEAMKTLVPVRKEYDNPLFAYQSDIDNEKVNADSNQLSLQRATTKPYVQSHPVPAFNPAVSRQTHVTPDAVAHSSLVNVNNLPSRDPDSIVDSTVSKLSTSGKGCHLPLPSARRAGKTVDESSSGSSPQADSDRTGQTQQNGDIKSAGRNLTQTSSSHLAEQKQSLPGDQASSRLGLQTNTPSPNSADSKIHSGTHSSRLPRFNTRKT